MKKHILTYLLFAVTLLGSAIMLSGCENTLINHTTNSSVQSFPSQTATADPTNPTSPSGDNIRWSMEAMLVTADGQLISNGTMRIEGNIVKQEDTQDLLLLNLILPSTLDYRYTDHSQSETGCFLKETDLPYYVSTDYCYSITDNAPVLYFFALDAEKGYFIMQWENLPGQYLIACRDGEVDPAVILAHFQGFLDRYAFEH